MKRITWLIVFLLLLFPDFVKANDCDNASREKLQKLSDNVTVSIEEIISDDGNVAFKATFAGLSDELIIRKTDLTYISFKIGDEKLGYAIDPNLKQNMTHKYLIKGFDNCYDVTFRTITINTPKYNIYYENELCKNNSNFYLCQKWLDTNKTEEEFEKEISQYLNANIKNEKPSFEKEKPTMLYLLYEKYYWPCLIALVLFLILLIYLWIWENKKNKL